MKTYFNLEGLESAEQESLLLELLRGLFYLPHEVMKTKQVDVKPIKVLTGDDAQAILYDLDGADNTWVKGDISLSALNHARQVAISERSYKGITFLVYKLWHPYHPSIPKLRQETQS